jgi:hypothetical protein
MSEPSDSVCGLYPFLLFISSLFVFFYLDLIQIAVWRHFYSSILLFSYFDLPWTALLLASASSSLLGLCICLTRDLQLQLHPESHPAILYRF